MHWFYKQKSSGVHLGLFKRSGYHPSDSPRSLTKRTQKRDSSGKISSFELLKTTLAIYQRFDNELLNSRVMLAPAHEILVHQTIQIIVRAIVLEEII